MTESIPLRPAGPHPTPEQLYRARHSPRDAEAERVLEHAAGCALCSTELARQEAFDEPEALPAGAVEAAWQRFGAEPVAARRSARQAPLLALAAAVVICVLGLGIWMSRQSPAPHDVERGAEGTAADWQPAGTLDAPPEAFVFPAPAGEPRRVKVFDATQSYTWTSEPTTGGRIVFPPAERQRLRPGVEYFWTVLDSDEERAAPSFRIRKANPGPP
jgi:hypothetical protein